MPKKKPGKVKHVPMRTCIACKTTKGKKELLRIVRTADGHVLLDPTSKRSGRGGYLCARRSCWDMALQKHILEHEFAVAALLPEDVILLQEYYETLPVLSEITPV